MPRLTDRIGLLRRTPRPARARALAAALRVAANDEKRVIAGALVDLCAPIHSERRRRLLPSLGGSSRDCATTLSRAWPDLPQEMRALALNRASAPLVLAAHGLASSPRATDRVAAADLAADADDPALVVSLPRLLADPDRSVAEQAERALSVLASRVHELSSETSHALDTALAAAAAGFADHRRRGVLSALAGLDAPGPAVSAWLRSPAQAGHMALRAAIRKLVDPGLRARCVGWLALEPLAAIAVERLAAPADPQSHATCLENHHRLLHPRRRKLLADGRRPAPALPSRDTLKSLPAPSRRGMPAWLLATAAPVHDKVERLVEFLADPEPLVRFAAVRAISEFGADDPASRGALVDFAFDRDARIAAVAAVALFDRPGRLTPTELRPLARSPHKRIRAAAADTLDAADPWSFARTGNPFGDAAAARLALQRDREAFVRSLRTRASTGEPSHRIAAILLARRLSLCPDLELELLAGVADPDARLAATAASALGAVRSGSALQAVEVCARHEDGRVRASAVEALARRAPDHSSVIEAVRDACARARANAIRARIARACDPTGERLLAEMLADDRPAHRVSALWLAERCAGPVLAERVADLARADEDPELRARARSCARRMLARMRSQWTDGPAFVDLPIVETPRRRPEGSAL